MARRIAIVALGPSHDEVPYGEWETWGIGWDPWAPRYDRLFEIHDRKLWEKRVNFVDRLNEIDLPVYMQKRHPEIPKSAEYPLSQVIGEVGDYFGSSISYLLALAIYEGVDEIGIWGVDLRDEAYEHQRHNLEYLIGFARGRGIHVSVAEGSVLLENRMTHHFQGEPVTYRGRYGWL